MYQISFDQTSNSEDWTENIGIIAADDGTPIDAVTDNIVATLQLRARTPRGFADQSQIAAVWPIGGLNFVNASGVSPVIDIATNDGSGQLTLDDGILTINVAASLMGTLIAGYYQVGIALSNPALSPTAIRQIAVGLLPIYDG